MQREADGHTSFGRADRTIRRPQSPNSLSTRYSRLSVVPRLHALHHSHAAAVLPLHRSSKHPLPLTALMIGSMAPDFGYFFSARGEPAIDAQPVGAVHVRVARGFVHLAFLCRDTREGDHHAVVRPMAQWRLAHTDAITTAASCACRPSRSFSLSCRVHSVGRVHDRGTFVTRAFPDIARSDARLSAGCPSTIFLHGLSSVVGLLFVSLLGACASALESPARSLIRPYLIPKRARIGALWFLALVVSADGVLALVPICEMGYYNEQFFSAAVGTLSGFFIAWCCIAVALWIPRAAPSAK